MEHWFDGLAKKLAAGDASRRTFLGGIFATFGATATSGSPRASGLAWFLPGEPDAALPQVRTEQRGPCTFEFRGKETTVHHSVQSTVNGKVLTHTSETTLTRPAQRGQGTPQITSTRTVTIGSDSLLRIEHDSRDGATQLKVTYGSAFQGIREATFTSDGKTIEGTIDGRHTLPLPVRGDASLLKFADGKTPPVVKLDPSVDRALAAILKQAKDDVASCKQIGAGRASTFEEGRPADVSSGAPAKGWISAFFSKLTASSPLTLTATPMSLGTPSSLFSTERLDVGVGYSIPSAASPNPVLPQTGGQGCQDCQNDCARDYVICEAAAGIGCVFTLFFAGACEASALIACSVTGATCLSTCDNAGNACCPVGCPNNGCCNSGEQCTSTADFCCPDGVAVCGITCCPAGFLCKDGACCTTDRVVCAGVCCPENQACSTGKICCPKHGSNSQPVSCGGTCCPEGQNCTSGVEPGSKMCCPDKFVCGDVCCGEGGTCKNGKCCGFSSQTGAGFWCGDHCCNGGGGQCVNGLCPPLCLTGVFCGASCCAWGCADARTNTCNKPQTCGKNQYVCTPNASNVPNVCCPNGTGCLDGKCCPTNTVSCNNKTTGVLGCWPQSQCAVLPPPK
jgi:hypothetical protein